MIKQRNIGKITCISILLLFLSGCWDQREIEENAFVIAVGLDRPENDDNRVKVTYLIANPEVGSSAQGGEAKEPPIETISFVADDFISARNLANTVIAKQITYDLLRFIFVSEDFAREESFIRWIYDTTKAMEIRRDTKLIITKENTETFIQNNQPKLETRPHEYFKMILERGSETGMIPPSNLNTYFRITEADADLFLGIYGTTEKSDESRQGKDPDQIVAGQFQYEGQTNTTQFAGSAVFKEGRMIDVLTLEETRLAFLLNPTLDAQDILATFPDPFKENYRIATRVNRPRSVDINMNLKNTPSKINVTLPLKIEVLTNHSMTEYRKNPGKREKLKKSFEEVLEKKIATLVKKTQEDFKAEPFGWSLAARQKFLTLPEWEEFDWMKSYPEMDVTVHVEVELGNFGRQGDIPKLKEVRD